MRIIVEVTTERDDTGDEGETLYEKDLYILLHWGLEYTIIEVSENMRTGVSYTVAICQNIKSGVIRCFRPEMLTVLGKEIKEQWNR